MNNMGVLLDQSLIRNAINAKDGPIARELMLRANAIAGEARRLVHENSTELEQSIHTRLVVVKGVIHADVFTDNDHAYWQEFDPPPQGKSFMRAAIHVATGKRGALLGTGGKGRRSRRFYGAHAAWSRRKVKKLSRYTGGMVVG